ncbi:hypothetical protein SAMD00019534_007920, partial [Acytostelium subglobosum LB1]|uniref:hypothetical protein n=1 Tax=Acytostelium subglobosum LB1 TaxID=1410327 RepID=UPI000644E94D
TTTIHLVMDVRFSIPGVVTRRFISEAKGRGLFAEKQFEKDEVIFTEPPLFAVQHVYNRPIAWTCGNCFRFLGSLNRQINHYRRLFNLKDKTELVPLPDNTTATPHEFQTAVLSCFAKCGEKYCSEACRQTAFQNHHQILCVGEHTPETSALYQFKKHAIETNELFFLGAQVIAYLISTVVHAKEAAPGEPRIIDIICQELFRQYAHRVWWEVRVDGNFTEQEAKQWATESLALLQKALVPVLTSHPKTNDQQFISTLLSMEFYSHVLGMLEMNDNSIRFKSPLEMFRRELDDMSAPEQYKKHSNNVLKGVVGAFRQYHMEQEEDCDETDCNHHDHNHMNDDHKHDHHDHSNCHSHSHGNEHAHGHSQGKSEEEEEEEEEEMEVDGNDDDEEEEEEEVFPEFDGFGLFGLQAMVNHSCEPNCLVAFEGTNQAYIKALRRIEPGEELFHTYIDENTPFEEREQELVTYGFKCDCAKCHRERPKTTSSTSTSTNS